MRTTVEIPDRLIREIKVHVVEKGETLKEFMVRAAEHELARVNGSSRNHVEITFPLIPSARPGSLLSMTNSEIDEILD